MNKFTDWMFSSFYGAVVGALLFLPIALLCFAGFVITNLNPLESR